MYKYKYISTMYMYIDLHTYRTYIIIIDHRILEVESRILVNYYYYYYL